MHCNDKCDILYYSDFILMHDTQLVKILVFINLSTVFDFLMRTDYSESIYHQQLLIVLIIFLLMQIFSIIIYLKM